MHLCKQRLIQQAKLPTRRNGARSVLPVLPALGRAQAHLVSVRRVKGLQTHAHNHQAAATDGVLAPQNPNLPAATGPAKAGPTKVNVHFEVPEYVTSWGQTLKVVGSVDELGQWKVDKAPAMEWHEGHSWTLDIQLPVGAVNFKVVMQEQGGNVRWEQGNDRSVLIPETTSVTGAPVGEVGVTCNFNDVNNSQVEVRPDRAFLKQQLKAVEARVMAIQEKKRKLDQRMAVLTEGLKNYDQTVALLEGGVQEAIEIRLREKEAVAQQQLHRAAVAAAIQGSSSGDEADINVPITPMAVGSSPNNGAGGFSSSAKGGIMVPIMNPADLPSFDDFISTSDWSSSSSVDEATVVAAPAAADYSTSDSAGDGSSSGEEDTQATQQSALITAAAVPDVNAIKASHVNETVLSATVEQLLAAAEDALERSSGGSSSAPVVKQGTTGVDSSQLAEEYVEELLAAASALEQQADQRANLLLEAAKQTGNDVIAEDLAQLSSLPMPKLPTPEQLAEAAAAEAAAAIDAATAADQVVVPASAASQEDISSRASTSSEFEQPYQQEEEEIEKPISVEQLAGLERNEPEPELEPQVAAAVEMERESEAVAAAADREPPPARPSTPLPAAAKVNSDGTLTFSAESLSIDVDVNELLAAVLGRIDVPLSSVGKVTISATIAPAKAAAPPAQEDAEERRQQQQEQQQDEVQPVLAAVHQQQHELQQQDIVQHAHEKKDDEPAQQQHASPADAIAAVFSSNLASSGSMDADDTTRGNGKNSSSWANGTRSGRYSKPSSRTSQGARVAAAAASRPPSPAWDTEEVDRQLAAKEAARKAAAEKVAAALAQVEEMRRSVIAANTLLSEQLRGSSSSPGDYSPMSPDPPVQRTVAPAPEAAAPSSMQGNSGTYSKYRIAFKDGKAVAAPVSSASAAAATAADASAGPLSASRRMPTVGAAAVMAGPQQQQATRSIQRDSRGTSGVDGVVKEELLALAALAATVQSADTEQQHQPAQDESQEEF